MCDDTSGWWSQQHLKSEHEEAKAISARFRQAIWRRSCPTFGRNPRLRLPSDEQCLLAAPGVSDCFAASSSNHKAIRAQDDGSDRE
jgi:hypothetical protein